MATRRLLLVTALVFPLSQLASAEPLTPAVRAEINALLARLVSSGCEFNRNGSWHTAAEAKSHLLGKLEYLERKNLVQSTEQFIERGAAGSSVSGKPYLVKCGNSAPVESKVWLSAELKAIRALPKSQAAPSQ